MIPIFVKIDINKEKFDADHSFWLLELMLPATRRLSLRNMKLAKKTTCKWQNYSFKWASLSHQNYIGYKQHHWTLKNC